MTATELAQAPAGASTRPPGWLRPLGALLAAQLVAGLLIGVFWRLWAPSSVSYLVTGDAGRPVVIPDESEAQIAGDGRFVLLSVLAGVSFALFAWTVRRYRGPVTAAVLVAGSLLGSGLAMITGRLLSSGPGTPALNSAFHPRLALHASAALFVQAFVAALVYTVLAGLSRDPELGLPTEPGPPGDPGLGLPTEPGPPGVAGLGRPAEAGLAADRSRPGDVGQSAGTAGPTESTAPGVPHRPHQPGVPHQPAHDPTAG